MRDVRLSAVCLVLCALFAASAAAAGLRAMATHPAQFMRCLDAEAAPDERIAACTTILGLGNANEQERMDALNARGSSFELKRDYGRAIADYSQMIALKPGDPAGYRKRCAVHVLAGEPKRALADCERQVQLAPKDPESYLARAEALDKLGEHDRAIENATQALSIARGHIVLTVYNRRAAFYRHKRDYARAIADSNRVLAETPFDWGAWNDRGLAYLGLRDVDRAFADFEEAIRISPRLATPLVNRAICHALRRRFDLALADMDRAIALEPNDGGLYRNRAFYHLLAENYDLAEADALRALRLSPGIADADSYIVQARSAKAAIASRKLAAPSKARIALVIGNGKYLYGPPLPNPVHDAEDVARELTKIGYTIYGYPKTDFTRVEMVAAIRAFYDAAKGAESAVVWYSGHGQEFVEVDGDFGRNYVIPVDARITKSKDIRTQAIPLSELLLSVMPAKGLRMVIVDACRTNDFDPAVPFRGFAREGRLGMLVVYSTKPGTYAADGDGRNSPFAAAFVAEMRGDAKDDLRALLARVSQRTSSATRNQQVPEVVDRYEPLERPVLVR